MNARSQLERLYHGGASPAPAPTIAPTKPATRPAERPQQPAPGPGVPDPWRRKTLQPGHAPRPKARYAQRVNTEAKEFLRLNGLEDFVK